MSRRKRRAKRPKPVESNSATEPSDAAASVDDSAPSRRRLLSRLWLLLTGALTLEIAWIAGSFLRPRGRALAEEATLVVVGPADGFMPGTVTAFPEGRFYLARLEDGGFLALDRTCPHLGCTVPWNPETARFDCPCHASSFDLSGELLSPPAPRPLDLYPVRIENGVVKVDVGRSVRRSSYDPSQAVRV